MEAAKKLTEDRIVVKRRKIMKTGNSYYVSIPYEFIQRLGLEPGEEVAVISKGEMVKVIAMN